MYVCVFKLKKMFTKDNEEEMDEMSLETPSVQVEEAMLTEAIDSNECNSANSSDENVN